MNIVETYKQIKAALQEAGNKTPEREKYLDRMSWVGAAVGMYAGFKKAKGKGCLNRIVALVVGGVLGLAVLTAATMGAMLGWDKIHGNGTNP
jgi:hypothetical protein